MTPRGTMLHVDGASGIAGDMCLGALVDLGVPLEHLRAGLDRLRVPGWSLDAEEVRRGAVRATRVHVRVQGDDDHHLHLPSGGPGPEDRGCEHAHGHGHEDHAHRTWPEIRRTIEAADLPARVRERSLAVFRALCAAEGEVHGIALEDVHLHEVGAVDAFVDVVGTCLGLEWLGVERVSCSPPDLGGGTVRCRHGLLPIPAPATLNLLRGRPVRSSGAEVELTTPTGAAILAALAGDWGGLPPMQVERTGWGAGSRELEDRANVVRFTLGRAPERTRAPGAGHVVIEADLDDADPQLLASFAARAPELGALDVVQQAVHMKKGRAGVRLCLLTTEEARPALVDALFAETTTIGCRWHAVERAECAREDVLLATPFGPVRAKVARWSGRVVNVKPEHDDCAAAARRAGVTLKAVLAAAAAEAGRIEKAT